MKIKKVYVILILNDEVIDLKTKIIAIVISVVITAGTATGVGIVVKQSNDKNTEDIVNAAISEALATADSSTSTTETTTTEESTTRKHLGAPQPASTTETTTENTTDKTTIEEVSSTQFADSYRVEYEYEYVKPSLEDRHCEQYKRAFIDGEITMVCIIKGNCPDAGKYCYWDKDDNLVYIDDLSQIDFLDE